MEISKLYASGLAVAVLCTILAPVAALAGGDHDGPARDFGLSVEQRLDARALPLFGVRRTVPASALGPYDGADNARAVTTAKGLHVEVVSNATDKQADQIALWPDDAHPTHLFVCVERFFRGNRPAEASVQRIDLAGDPDHNVETIVTGISSCDPIRRTPWNTLLVGEEAGETGALYEILDPMGIRADTPVVVRDRTTGETSDPDRVVKRKAVGNLSFEGMAVLPDGTLYLADEKRPLKGEAGGAIYKFVPDRPYRGGGPIRRLADSPLESGTNYGMRLGTRKGNTDYGQGSETGKGVWVAIDSLQYSDPAGNISLRHAQRDLSLTGYYRPEDMDIDPVAMAHGRVRVCWANTGRMTNGFDSAVENGWDFGSVACLMDRPELGAATRSSPIVTRFVHGDRDANHFDNVAFQPHTGRLVALEDGEVEVLNADGSLKERRGNDVWMCLRDGADRDLQTDGCVRILSLRDTASEPTGWTFDAAGRTAYVNLQHRATGRGALLRSTGFRIHHEDGEDGR